MVHNLSADFHQMQEFTWRVSQRIEWQTREMQAGFAHLERPLELQPHTIRR